MTVKGIVFVIIAIWFGVFIFSSYHAVINGYTWATWLTGICLWILGVSLVGVGIFTK